MQRVLLIAILTVFGLFVADAVALRLPLPPGRAQFGVVQVRRYYTMPLKGSKTEFGDAGIENVTCAHSLFPHSGYPPCWYAARHTTKWVTQ
jgi:hypothetical protein